jgi:LPXTG-motif cell wall-anchored protein
MVKNLSSDDGGRVTLYAVWTKDTDGDAETDAKTDAKTDSDGGDAKTDSDGGDAASGIAIPISSEDGDVLPMTGDMNATSVAAIIGLAGLAVMLVSFAVRKRTGSR